MKRGQKDAELNEILDAVKLDYAKRGENRALFVAVVASLVPSVIGSLIGGALFLIWFK